MHTSLLGKIKKKQDAYCTGLSSDRIPEWITQCHQTPVKCSISSAPNSSQLTLSNPHPTTIIASSSIFALLPSPLSFPKVPFTSKSILLKSLFNLLKASTAFVLEILRTLFPVQSLFRSSSASFHGPSLLPQCPPASHWPWTCLAMPNHLFCSQGLSTELLLAFQTRFSGNSPNFF